MGLVEDLGLSDLTVHQVSDRDPGPNWPTAAEFPQFAAENPGETPAEVDFPEIDPFLSTPDKEPDQAANQSTESPHEPIILAGQPHNQTPSTACQIIGLDSPVGGIGVSKFGEILTLYLRSQDYWAEMVSQGDSLESLRASNDYLLLDLPEIIRNQRFSKGLILSANSAPNSAASSTLGDRNFPKSAAPTPNPADPSWSGDVAPNPIANLHKLIILVPVSTLGLRKSLPWLKSLSDFNSPSSPRSSVVLIPASPNYRFHTRNLTKSELLTILQTSSIGHWEPDSDSPWLISEIYSFHRYILRMSELDQPIVKFPRPYPTIFNNCL